MELHGAEYLYNLSILAITFATVSALVTIVRQIKGGSLSMVDVHLLTTFMTAGFVQCIAAVLPPAFSLFGLSDRALWTIASGAAALLYAGTIARIQWERSKFSKKGFGPLVLVAFAGLWVSNLILIVNAVVPSVQGIGLYAGAITLSLGPSMWSFVRRIGTLGSHHSHGDWDLRRG